MYEEHLKKAWQLLDKGNYDAARAEFARAIAEKPNDITALIGLSKALARLGRYDEALKTIKIALSIDSGEAEAHYGAACLYYQKRKWREAELHIQQAITLDPKEAQYRLAAAELARRRRDMEGALMHLEAANRMAPAIFVGRAQWTLTYFKIFAGVEKMGLLMGWAVLATIQACAFASADLHWWLLVALLPFLGVSGWHFKKRRYRRAVWALVLWVLWAVSTYLIVGWLVGW